MHMYAFATTAAAADADREPRAERARERPSISSGSNKAFLLFAREPVRRPYFSLFAARASSRAVGRSVFFAWLPRWVRASRFLYRYMYLCIGEKFGFLFLSARRRLFVGLIRRFYLSKDYH